MLLSSAVILIGTVLFFNNYLRNDHTINGDYSGNLLRVLRMIIKSVHPWKLTKGILFYQENVPVYKSLVSMATVALKWLTPLLILLIWPHLSISFFHEETFGCGPVSKWWWRRYLGQDDSSPPNQCRRINTGQFFSVTTQHQPIQRVRTQENANYEMSSWTFKKLIKVIKERF